MMGRHGSPSRHRIDNRGPQCFFLGKRDSLIGWTRLCNQVISQFVSVISTVHGRIHRLYEFKQFFPSCFVKGTTCKEVDSVFSY